MIDFIHIAQATEVAVEAATEDPGVVGLLGINWKLFLAQLVNFSVILFILWRWVFKPVTGALQKRTATIEKSLSDAEEIKKKMVELETYTKEQIAKANTEYQAILAKAEQTSVQQKEAILAEARDAASRMVKEAETRVAADKESMMSEVKTEVADMVVMAMEKVIHEKLTSEKDKQYIREVLAQTQKGKA